MWDNELAKRIKKIDKKTNKGIGHGVGTIVSKEPLKISFADGQILLDEDDLTLTESFRQKLSNIDDVKKNDKVIVLSIDGQSFFVIDKVG